EPRQTRGQDVAGKNPSSCAAGARTSEVCLWHRSAGFALSRASYAGKMRADAARESTSMDATTSVAEIDALLLYDVDDPTVKEIIPYLLQSDITIKEAGDFSPPLRPDEDAATLLRDVRTVVLLFGKSGWRSTWLLGVATWARSSKPFIPVLVAGADEKE